MGSSRAAALLTVRRRTATINPLIQELDNANRLAPEDVELIKGLLLALAVDRRARLEASSAKAIAESCGPVGPVEPPAA